MTIYLGTSEPKKIYLGDGMTILHSNWNIRGVKYIQGTGTQYVNLSYDYQLTDKIEIKINPQSIGNSIIFGAKSGPSSNYLAFYNNKLRWVTGSVIEAPCSTNKDYTIICENGKLTVNGVEYTGTAASSVTSGNIWLFGGLNGQSNFSNGSFKLYYYKQRRNGNLAITAEPALNASNSPGIWRGSFFETNSGTGTFLYEVFSATAVYLGTTKVRPTAPTIDFLMVGGGGAGGRGYAGGGGGGGGVIYCSGYELNSKSECVMIGCRGVNSTKCQYEGCSGVPFEYAQGGDTKFLGLTAYGGGWGGYFNYGSSYMPASSGGSGGGGTNCYVSGCSGVSGQGKSGGNGCCNSGGGGGGGGAAGGIPSGSGYRRRGGKGGCGYYSDISGVGCYYGTGGGGGGCLSETASTGGGKGGYGYSGAAMYGCDATYYGGGGGGGQGNQAYGGHGYQGVVIVRYPTGSANLSGGCKYTCGGYTIHCFTSNGTLTAN